MTYLNVIIIDNHLHPKIIHDLEMLQGISFKNRDVNEINRRNNEKTTKISL